MALPDLTDLNIQDTFQRVIQTDGNKIYDGTGSLLPIEFNENNVIISGTLTAQTYVVSESIVNVSSGSTMFGNSSDDIHQVTGSLLVTGSIIQSGSLSVTGSIIQSGPQQFTHIQTPKLLLPYLGLVSGVDSTGAEQTIISNVANGFIQFGDDDAATVIEGNLCSISTPSTLASGHITSSGNISSSGELIGIIDGGSF